MEVFVVWGLVFRGVGVVVVIVLEFWFVVFVFVCVFIFRGRYWGFLFFVL